ncbi:MAG: thioredoxin domain-containing protein [Saccharospirillaceae bacterium]|nr:thioredoxin domain-containing protein [Saccharospirillaceae bacterium]
MINEVAVAVSVTLSTVALILSVISYFTTRTISKHITNPLSIFALILVAISLYLLSPLITQHSATMMSQQVNQTSIDAQSGRVEVPINKTTRRSTSTAVPDMVVTPITVNTQYNSETTSPPQLLEIIDKRPKLGNPDADYTVAIFTDIECEFCQQHHAEIIRSVKLLGEKVNFTYLNLPNQKVHGDIALQKAIIAECVNEVSGVNAYFSSMTDMFGALGASRSLKAASDDAMQYSVDWYENCDKEARLKDIEQHVNLAGQYDISATPTSFLLNNKTGHGTFETGVMNSEELTSKLGMLDN